MLIAAFSALGAGSFIYMNNPENNGLPAAIQAVKPANGDNVLSQVEIVVDLAQGYDSDISINGVDVPREELNIIAGLNLLSYRPGPGKAVERLLPDQNCVQATYWELAVGPHEVKIYTWCFFTS